MVNIGKYFYPEEVMETVKMNKKIRNDISEFCKKRKINKSKLVENFYKAILLRFKDGSLAVGGYITINIFEASN